MASFLVKGGLRTVMIEGLPDDSWLPAADIQAIVIALKSRTEPVEKAVTDSLACFRWLHQSLNTRQLYFKYCSTFDSTPTGNIGPVIDAVLEAFELEATIISPALPVNGRSVFEGHLFVNGDLLENSSMRFHPLTPMTESSLLKLIEAQGKGKAAKINYQLLDQGVDAVNEVLSSLNGVRYFVPDHFNDNHAETIVRSFVHYTFITGSSGLAEPLARLHAQQSENQIKQTPMKTDTAPTLVLAGSCSVATREQIHEFEGEFNSYRIEPENLNDPKSIAEEIWQWIAMQDNKPCLVFSSDDPENVERIQKTSGPDVSHLLEQTFGLLAKKSVSNGIRRLIVAGGETS
ncbi:MAG: 3-oxo-tetronate kinase, partial [Methyloligellaceae bacterium]